MKLNDSDGAFQYLVHASSDAIQMRIIVRMDRAVFNSGEYNDLRSFFDFIVKKEAEQIVLKKKA